MSDLSFLPLRGPTISQGTAEKAVALSLDLCPDCNYCNCPTTTVTTAMTATTTTVTTATPATTIYVVRNERTLRSVDHRLSPLSADPIAIDTGPMIPVGLSNRIIRIGVRSLVFSASNLLSPSAQMDANQPTIKISLFASMFI